MLTKKEIEDVMNKRGFTIYSTTKNRIHFVSKSMFDSTLKQSKPAINIVVYIDTQSFQCLYNVPKSINSLKSPKCGPVESDKQFNSIVGKFESQAKILERFCS